MIFSKAQRKAILAGKIEPALFDDEPACEQGDIAVLLESQEERYIERDEYGGSTGQVLTIPARWLVWAVIISKVRRKKGGWAVRFDLFDTRARDQYLAKQQGQYSPAAYTTSAHSAIDDVSAVDQETIKRFVTENRAKDIGAQARKDQERKQMRAVKENLRETLSALPEESKPALFAALHRELEGARGSSVR